MRTVSYSWDTDTSTGFAGTTFARLKNQTTTVFEMGTSVNSATQAFEYGINGNYGNVSKITETAGAETVETILTYAVDPDNWILNRPIDVKKTSGGSTLQWNQFVYTGNNLTEKKDYLDTGSKWVSTFFAYDDCGNVTSITYALGKISNLVYDSEYNAFVTEIKNPLGHTVRKTYDAGTGNVLTETDPNGNTYRNEYDGFGRLVRQYNAGNVLVKDVNYHDELLGDAGNQFIETKVYQTSSGNNGFERSYFDGLGRVYRTVTKAFTHVEGGATFVNVVDKSFNAQGVVESESRPYMAEFNGSTGEITPRQTIFSTKYSYDSAGRVIKKEHPESTTAIPVITEYLYSYSGNNSVIGVKESRGNWNYSTFNARGKLIRKVEPLGASIDYAYDSIGRLIQTTDAANRITSIYYDSLGRRTGINDPNTGEWNYAFDDAGRLVTQIDANGNTMTFSYDDANRLILEESSDGTDDVTYAYDGGTNGIGRLYEVSDGVTENRYGYNTEGGTAYWRQSVDGMDFVFRMEYDLMQRPVKISYPDGTEIGKAYTDTGQLKAVTAGEGAYVQYGLVVNQDGSFNNQVRRRTGNGVETVIGFDPATLRPTAVVSTNQASQVLENVSYMYDTVGNITQLADNINTQATQAFEYDALNRLTHATGIYGTQEYSYGATGNLTSNHHGSLSYSDPSHPQAVTTDGQGNVYAYDANGNMTSHRGRTLRFNARNRLTSIEELGSELQTYYYDYSGARVKQTRDDGTVIYTIGGLYEVVKAPGRDDNHTKFIHGISGDLVSQVTNANSTLVASGNVFAYDGRYGGNPIMRALYAVYVPLHEFLLKPQHVVIILRILVILSMIAVAVLGFYFRVFRRESITMPFRWAADLAPAVLLIFVGTFGIAGCDVFQYADLLGGGGGSSPSSTGGLPTIGTYYFHPDQVGSVKMLTDAQGNVVTRMAYTPYGERVSEQCSGPDVFHQKFTGQRDDNSGLYFYNARYYDPAIGRFASADSVVPSMIRSQAYNRYMYVEGNPVSLNDPTGHSPYINNYIPYIGEDITTNGDGRESDMRFNLFKQDDEITGREGDDYRNRYWTGENGGFTIFLDRTILHPTAVLHDWYVTKYEISQTGWESVLFYGSMPICSIIATQIAFINLNTTIANFLIDCFLFYTPLYKEPSDIIYQASKASINYSVHAMKNIY